LAASVSAAGDVKYLKTYFPTSALRQWKKGIRAREVILGQNYHVSTKHIDSPAITDKIYKKIPISFYYNEKINKNTLKLLLVINETDSLRGLVPCKNRYFIQLKNSIESMTPA